MTTSSTAGATGTSRAGVPDPEPADQGALVRPETAGTRADVRLVAAAVADARSGRPVEPGTPAGPARQRWREPARRVPGAGAGEVDLDTVLTLSLAARRAAGAGTSGGNAKPARGTMGAATDGTRTDRAGARPRAAASAGGRYPVRAHLLVGPDCPLPPGRPAWCAAVGGADPGLLAPAGAAAPGGGSPATGHPDRTVQNPDDRTPAGHGAGGGEDLPAPGRDTGRAGFRPDSAGEPSRHAVRDEPHPYGSDASATAQATSPRLMAHGEARPTLASWPAGQGWLADAGAVLLAHGAPAGAPPDRVRAEHLSAGYAAACAEVIATALGLRTRPVGSWQRADLGAALGRAAGERWVVHGLALAAPEDPVPAGREGPVPAPPAQAAADAAAPGSSPHRPAPLRPRDAADPNSAGNERR